MRQVSLPSLRKRTIIRPQTSINSSQFINRSFLPKKPPLPEKSSYSWKYRPVISAKAWIIINTKNGQTIRGRNELEKREIASLTKIMTCFLSIKLAERTGTPYNQIIRVSAAAQKTGGTSAKLRECEELELWDLLHALMLPSGNDAAICLAEFFGRLISIEGDPVRNFVKGMNETARELGLRNTFFENPHGMSTTTNISTAEDVGKLACQALKSKEFRAICNTLVHNARIKCESVNRIAVWHNTNKLLKFGFDGVKTGFTQNAGPCLCTHIEKWGIGLVQVVLNCQGRWEDVPVLADWAFSILNQIKPERFTHFR